EILRFLPDAGSMPAPFRSIFLWRACQVFVVPLAATVAVVAAARIAVDLVRAGVPATAAAAGIVFAAAPLAFLRRAARDAVGLAALLAVAVGAAVVSFPFFRQRASFR